MWELCFKLLAHLQPSQNRWGGVRGYTRILVINDFSHARTSTPFVPTVVIFLRSCTSISHIIFESSLIRFFPFECRQFVLAWNSRIHHPPCRINQILRNFQSTIARDARFIISNLDVRYWSCRCCKTSYVFCIEKCYNICLAAERKGLWTSFMWAEDVILALFLDHGLCPSRWFRATSELLVIQNSPKNACRKDLAVFSQNI